MGVAVGVGVRVAVGVAVEVAVAVGVGVKVAVGVGEIASAEAARSGAKKQRNILIILLGKLHLLSRKRKFLRTPLWFGGLLILDNPFQVLLDARLVCD